MDPAHTFLKHYWSVKSRACDKGGVFLHWPYENLASALRIFRDCSRFPDRSKSRDRLPSTSLSTVPRSPSPAGATASPSQQVPSSEQIWEMFSQSKVLLQHKEGMERNRHSPSPTLLGSSAASAPSGSMPSPAASAPGIGQLSPTHSHGNSVPGQRLYLPSMAEDMIAFEWAEVPSSWPIMYYCDGRHLVMQNKPDSSYMVPRTDLEIRERVRQDGYEIF
ncbi:hypothetical protein E2C01_029570 [Portunus trituberculatus]|uniref:Uncharacterized protein n=1 Tax=Portunus trituberculatus TaxID=210409 RepID=A0A5B7EPP9_PORTR|nr:hypothetical protein [Portunus trituberculatus]